ncbi:hypothetical protein L484_017480 [Morus notabilis]|uniref:Uncharacterized protein n=1 Tax=Morus notabilis TaxID=981085 RepID=W9QWA1_9ROSA|nr:hypothetical protein L484_017480 [Morus notabilis]
MISVRDSGQAMPPLGCRSQSGAVVAISVRISSRSTSGSPRDLLVQPSFKIATTVREQEERRRWRRRPFTNQITTSEWESERRLCSWRDSG